MISTCLFKGNLQSVSCGSNNKVSVLERQQTPLLKTDQCYIKPVGETKSIGVVHHRLSVFRLKRSVRLIGPAGEIRVLFHCYIYPT